MSHLGDNLSALVDGELAGADLDRASSHLASCERCRGDAVEMRALKNQLRGLAVDSGDDDLTLRLLAMAGGPFPPLDHADAANRPPRRRYLVWGALSLAVVGGVGAAAFSMGGNPSDLGPDVVPQVEMFDMQHASVTGDVPFPEPPEMARAADHKP
ncbi:MAG: zf-HC2 domain-containing protein [Nocardiopsaceae bacterium]|nr:zf-HC2 domain-containing protein [Nocardiopsaceae bacterium]